MKKLLLSSVALLGFTANGGAFANDIVGVSNNGAPIRRGAVSGGDDSGEFFVARVGLNYKFGSY